MWIRAYHYLFDFNFFNIGKRLLEDMPEDIHIQIAGEIIIREIDQLQKYTIFYGKRIEFLVLFEQSAIEFINAHVRITLVDALKQTFELTPEFVRLKIERLL